MIVGLCVASGVLLFSSGMGCFTCRALKPKSWIPFGRPSRNYIDTSEEDKSKDSSEQADAIEQQLQVVLEERSHSWEDYRSLIEKRNTEKALLDAVKDAYLRAGASYLRLLEDFDKSGDSRDKKKEELENSSSLLKEKSQAYLDVMVSYEEILQEISDLHVLMNFQRMAPDYDHSLLRQKENTQQILKLRSSQNGERNLGAHVFNREEPFIRGRRIERGNLFEDTPTQEENHKLKQKVAFYQRVFADIEMYLGEQYGQALDTLRESCQSPNSYEEEQLRTMLMKCNTQEARTQQQELEFLRERVAQQSEEISHLKEKAIQEGEALIDQASSLLALESIVLEKDEEIRCLKNRLRVLKVANTYSRADIENIDMGIENSVVMSEILNDPEGESEDSTDVL